MVHIVSHRWPHIEEVVGYQMLRERGEKFFPGISRVIDLEFVETADAAGSGDLAETKGRIMVGAGNGRFDEHPVFGKAKKKGDCAATLVARFLGSMEDPAWRRLLEFVTLNDLKGIANPFDLGYLPKPMYHSIQEDVVVTWIELAVKAISTFEAQQKEFDPEVGLAVFDRSFAVWLLSKFGKDEDKIPDGQWFDFVFGSNELISAGLIERLGAANDPNMKKILEFFYEKSKQANIFDIKGIPALIHALVDCSECRTIPIDWVHAALDAKYAEQGMFRQAVKDFDAKAQITDVLRPDGKIWKIATMDGCNNWQMGKAARYRGAAMLIQRTTSGHVQIFTNKKLGVDIRELAAMIRVVEQKRNNLIITTKWRDLQEEGCVPGVLNWYYHVEGQMLLNGSLTAKQPKTKLSLDEILSMAEIVLFPERFFSGKHKQCQRGVCSKPCPWHRFGLDRCMKVRKGHLVLS